MPPRASSRKRKATTQPSKRTPTKSTKKPKTNNSNSDKEDDAKQANQSSNDELKADTTCKFQDFVVTEDTPIKEFAEKNGFPLDRRGFYEFTKPERVCPAHSHYSNPFHTHTHTRSLTAVYVLPAGCLL